MERSREGWWRISGQDIYIYAIPVFTLTHRWYWYTEIVWNVCCWVLINLWIHILIHLLISHLFNRANIFSFTDFPRNIFTLQGSLRGCLSNQGYYFEFHFYHKSLKTRFLFWQMTNSLNSVSTCTVKYSDINCYTLLYICTIKIFSLEFDTKSKTEVKIPFPKGARTPLFDKMADESRIIIQRNIYRLFKVERGNHIIILKKYIHLHVGKYWILHHVKSVLPCDVVSTRNNTLNAGFVFTRQKSFCFL